MTALWEKPEMSEFEKGVVHGRSLAKAEKTVVGNINNYPTYYQTVVASPKWLAWGKVAHQHGFDWDESVEIEAISLKHFHAFLAWIINEA